MTTATGPTARGGTVGAIRTFLRHDLRTIRRDSIFVILVIGPFGYAAACWLLPTLDAWTRQRWAFDLTPYFPLIITGFPILGPPMLQGAMLGLQVLDDRDQHTLAALRVTPLPTAFYAAYRAGLTVVVCTLLVPLSLAITGLATPAQVLAAVPIGLVGGLLAVTCGLAMARIAHNKVEGLAVYRVIGLLVAVPPLVPFFFLDRAWHHLFMLLPPYWPARAWWAVAAGGEAYWPYLLGGLVCNGLLAAFLIRSLRRLT